MLNTAHPGQLLCVGFEGLEPSSVLLDRISAGKIGCVVLFSRNIRDARQLAALTSYLLQLAPKEHPLLLAIDQEGGCVQRLRSPWTEWPTMRSVGERNDLDVTAEVARSIARELRDLGICLDFAPVVDVDTNPHNPIIGDRSFSSDPRRVAAHVKTFIRAMQSVGVAACAKHFPGHGDTVVDSHLALPTLTHRLERLQSVELAPFRAAVEAGVASIMTAHILYPALDTKFPATLSHSVLQILRKDLAYDGVVFSDDLEMKAVAEHYTLEDCVLRSLQAGVDSLLVCKTEELWLRALEILESAPPQLLRDPLRRVRALKARYAKTSLAGGYPPYTAHQKLAHTIGKASDLKLG